MKIVNLIEDTRGDENCHFEHGLSFYIETKKHKLLCDTGASAATLRNARMLGIDLAQVDTVILSHGHYDHTGGVMDFVQENTRAQIFMQRSAGYDYYNLKEGREKYIGIDKEILKLSQLELIEGNRKIDEELSLFAGIQGRKLWAKSNLLLKRKVDGVFNQDTFDHEQCLVISSEEKKILLSGCAHNGILNILDRYREVYKGYPDIVISGFHLTKAGEYVEDEIQDIQETARELKKIPAIFYTGHCTGHRAYEIMKKIMGVQLKEIHSGEVLL